MPRRGFSRNLIHNGFDGEMRRRFAMHPAARSSHSSNRLGLERPIRREKSFKSVVFASLVPGSRHACDPPLSWVGQSLVAVFFDPINSATPLLERNAISKSGAIGTLALFLRLRKVV